MNDLPVSRQQLIGLSAAFVAFAAISLAPWATVHAVGAASTGTNACIGFYIAKATQAAQACDSDDDCSDGEICFNEDCVDREVAREELEWRVFDDRDEDDGDDEQQAAESPADLDTAQPIPDDGGADAVCGADRRCRIERIATRNRMRRHYRAGQQEQAVYDEVDDLLAEEESLLNRENDPWSIAYQRHQFGLGLLGGRTFGGHFRAEATLVYQDRLISYSPDADSLSSISGVQSALFATAHLTFLPARAWLSPLISVGFGMGRGSFGSPDVRYDFVTAAVGAEAQLDSGLMFRLAYRDGLLLYNQVRHGPGSYDSETRDSLREYMHDEGLGGIDFSIGWAF